jgi:DNA-directed RNA polymerase specialized sigma24 family protein
MSRQTVLEKSKKKDEEEDLVVEVTRTTRYHVKVPVSDLTRAESRNGVVDPNHLVPNNPGALIERLRSEGLFDEVPAMCQNIVVLHYVEGMTLGQVAEKLGITLTKAKCLERSAITSARQAAKKGQTKHKV